MPNKTTEDTATRIIKKYPNRRVYDTAESRYIVMDDLRKMVLEDVPFVVVDSKSGEDVTRSVLLQLILEQELSTSPLFTTDQLRSLINYCNSNQHQMFTEFLSQSMKVFQFQESQLKKSLTGAIDFNPVAGFSEFWKSWTPGGNKKD